MGDETQRRPSRPPDLLRFEERADTQTMRQTRTKAKVTTNTLRNNIVARVDYGVEIMCIMLAVDQMQRGEFECWLALKEGVLFEKMPKKRMRNPIRRTWFVIPPPAKTASVEYTARHYGYTEESVRRMDQRARKTLNEMRAAAGLLMEVPRVQIWPAVMSQRAMMDHLFG